MADFSIYDYGPDWIGVDIPQYTAHTWYNVFVYDARGNIYHDQWYYHNSWVSLQVEVTGLEPETEYTVEVSSATSSSGTDLMWWGSLTVTTTASTGGGGSTDTVRVDVDFDTEQIYSVRLMWNDGTDDVREDFYEPGWIEVAENSYIEVLRVYQQDAYADVFPIYCKDEDSLALYEVKDANGDWKDDFLYVGYHDVTFRFYIDSTISDLGQMKEVHVRINGQRYLPMIFDSSGMFREYKAYISF